MSGALVTRDLLVGTVGLDRAELTVVRMVLHLQAFVNGFTGALDSVESIDMGIGVASDQAFAVAAGAGLPDPRVLSQAPPRGWLWKGRFAMAYANTNADEKGPYHFPTLDFDLRAGRKVDRGTLFFIGGKTTIVGSTVDVQLAGMVRILLLT